MDQDMAQTTTHQSKSDLDSKCTGLNLGYDASSNGRPWGNAIFEHRAFCCKSYLQYNDKEMPEEKLDSKKR